MSTTRPATVSNAPLYAVWALSAVAITVAPFQNVLWSLIAYGVLLVASLVGLISYRVALTRATRTAAGSGAILGVRRLEKVTIVVVALASAANGLVIGLWLGAMELWFK